MRVLDKNKRVILFFAATLFFIVALNFVFAVDNSQSCVNECLSDEKGCSADRGVSWACESGDDGCYHKQETSCDTGLVCNLGECVDSSVPGFVFDITAPGGSAVAECNDDEIKGCGTDVGECKKGEQLCMFRKWSDCNKAIGPVAEICDTKDNDCDGTVDEGCDCVPGRKQNVECGIGECYKKDQLECAFGRWSPEVCVPKQPGDEVCDGKDNDCDDLIDDDLTAPVSENQDGVCQGSVKVCDGIHGWIEPDYSLIEGYGKETCDHKDNDCDNEIDEGNVCLIVGTGTNISADKKATKLSLKAIAESADFSETLKELDKTKKLLIMSDDKLFVDIDLNDSELTGMDLSSIRIEKQNSTDKSAYVLFHGLNMANITKTIYLDIVNPQANAVCIKDAEVENISQVSSSCTGENEFIVACPGTGDVYSCQISDSKYVVSGLKHSAVIEFVLPEPAPVQASSGGGGYIAPKKVNKAAAAQPTQQAAAPPTAPEQSDFGSFDDLDYLADDAPQQPSAPAQYVQPSVEKPTSIFTEKIQSFWWVGLLLCAMLVVVCVLFVAKRHHAAKSSEAEQGPIELEQGMDNEQEMRREYEQKLQQLEIYVRDALIKGYSRELLREHLVRNGFPSQIVDDVMKRV